MKNIVILFLFVSCNIVLAQTKTSDTDFLKNLLSDHASPQLKHILQHPDSFHYQIIYTRIDRDKLNQASFFQLLLSCRQE